MKNHLDPEQIDFYRQNGYIVIDDFLEAAALSEWRSAVEEALNKRDKMKLPDRQWVGHGDDEVYYEKVFTQRLQLWKDNERVRKLMLDERLGKMAAKLAGVDGIRIWHDQALVKPPFGEPTAWHLDVPFWSFSSKQAISIWVALDDITKENGCLYFMPGTQEETSFDNPGITEEIASLFGHYPQFRSRDTVAVTMKAGSCSFHSGSVVHAAGANMTPYPRRAMTCAYMPDGSTFNGQQNILNDREFAQLEVGQVLDDNEKFPLIYSTQVPA